LGRFRCTRWRHNTALTGGISRAKDPIERIFALLAASREWMVATNLFSVVAEAGGAITSARGHGQFL
jgi:hypothetical protein